jgi:hypothetical protein
MRARPTKQRPKRTQQPVARRETAVVPEWLIVTLTGELPDGFEVTEWTAERSKPHANAFLVTGTVSGGDLDGSERATWLTDRLKAPGQVYAMDDLAERLTALPRRAEMGDPGRHGADQHGGRAGRRRDQTGGARNPVHAGHARTTGGS